ncbi:MAG: hypothetical protein CMP40_02880 [Rickettsiales bacterium]|nr:hypothetical protein [Rickettsiales bacterium]
MELTVEQALQQGVAAHKEGRVEEAERLYRAILQSQPSHPDANHNLGLIAASVNEAESALLFFKIAFEANPKMEQFWLSYIDLLIKEQQFEAAKQVIEKVKSLEVGGEKLNSLEARLVSISQTENTSSSNPSQQKLSSLLEHYQQGRFGIAEKLAESITQEFPNHPFGWKVLGASLGQTGRNLEAANANQTVVKLSPKDAEAHNNLGVTQQELGKLEEAQASYTKAIELKPDYAEAHNNLGNTQLEMGKLKEAEASYSQAVYFKPEYAKVHSKLGITLQEMGKLEEAKESYSRAIGVKPDYAEAHSNLGNTLKQLGKFEEAKKSYEQAIALKPNLAEVHRNLTLIKRYDSRDEQYLKMKELYLDKEISEEQLCHINFGLAKVYEDLEEFEQAYSHYSEGNALRKKLLNYKIARDVELFSQIKTRYPQLVQNSVLPTKSLKDPTPIFILGMPRSGTTLVEQIISSHSQVSGAGELPFVNQLGGSLARGLAEINNDALQVFRREYLTKIQKLAKKNSIITDKMPQNFRFIGLIITTMPESKIVHVKRSPAAVCWANYKQYFETKNLGYCYDLDDIIQYYRLYENLMEFWKNSLDTKIYDLDYEVLVENQDSETRKLIAFLNLDWDENCLSPHTNSRSISTASNIQVRKKVYQGSSQQWKKFKPFLNGAFDDL